MSGFEAVATAYLLPVCATRKKPKWNYVARAQKQRTDLARAGNGTLWHKQTEDILGRVQGWLGQGEHWAEQPCFRGAFTIRKAHQSHLWPLLYPNLLWVMSETQPMRRNLSFLFPLPHTFHTSMPGGAFAASKILLLLGAFCSSRDFFCQHLL